MRWRKPPYCGFGVELFIVEIDNDIGLRRFWLEGVADDCCDDGCFGLALDFCLFADSFEDSAMIPDLWGALLIREHCPAQSLDLLTSRACFFFFFDRHKMGHLWLIFTRNKSISLHNMAQRSLHAHILYKFVCRPLFFSNWVVFNTPNFTLKRTTFPHTFIGATAIGITRTAMVFLVLRQFFSISCHLGGRLNYNSSLCHKPSGHQCPQVATLLFPLLHLPTL